MSESNSSEKKTSRRFTPLEDQKLHELVGQFGAKRWRRIAQYMPGRAARQCRDRYCNYLSPDFYNNKWTPEEDYLLYEKYQEYGTQWAKITQFFPGKNANNIKNRWNYSVSRINFDDKTKIPNSNYQIQSSNQNSSNFSPYGLNSCQIIPQHIQLDCSIPNTTIISPVIQRTQFPQVQINPQPLNVNQNFPPQIPQTYNTSMIIQSDIQLQTNSAINDLNSSNYSLPLIPENVCSLRQSSFAKKDNITTNVYDVMPKLLPSIHTLIAEIETKS